MRRVNAAMSLNRYLISILILLLSHSELVSAVNSVEQLYESHQESIVQIQIIERKSGSQNSIGSGFFIMDGSFIATNYHVVSSVVMEGEKYRISFEYKGVKYEPKVSVVNVVNDLAILSTIAQGPALEVVNEDPLSGSRLFSIGNPHDIGKTVVEGNYNGLVDNRFFDMIHFSGAINPGMSGGPTLNAQGQIVGINVASSGNQIGFLVPARFLSDLIEKVKSQTDTEIDFKTEIARQVGSATRYMVDTLLTTEWELDTLGDAKIVGKMHDAIECWGDSDDNEETGLNEISKGCSVQNSIYLSNDLSSGFIEYEFYYLEGKDWPTMSFYKTLSKRFTRARSGNKADKEEVENYQCKNEEVEHNGIRRKISYCVRPYINLPNLFDTFYISKSIDKPNKSIVEHFTLSGVEKDTAQKFLERFILEVSWR